MKTISTECTCVISSMGIHFGNFRCEGKMVVSRINEIILTKFVYGATGTATVGVIVVGYC